MKATKDRGGPLEVALCLESTLIAQDLSVHFRDLGVIPHYYAEMTQLWQALSSDPVDLVILDVRQMAVSELYFKNHPRFSEFTLIFYCSEADSPLVRSTLEIPHLGLLHQSFGPLRAQLKQLIDRFFEYESWNQKIEFSQKQYHQLENQVQSALEATEMATIKQDYQKVLMKLAESLERSSDFMGGLAQVVQEWDLVEQFTVWELNSSGQKLLSLPLSSSKYRELPGIWLGQVCQEGIDHFAQNLASQIVFDEFGAYTIPLRLFGEQKHPDKLIFLQVAEDVYSLFPWEILEKLINTPYSRFQMQMLSGKQVFQMEIGSFLERIDHLVYDRPLEGVDPYYQMIDIDLSDLQKEIVKRPQNRFLYRSFLWEFSRRLKSLCLSDEFFTQMEPTRFALVLKNREESQRFKQLKLMVNQFPYWKYFENTDQVVSAHIEAKIKVGPLTSAGYLAFLSGESELGRKVSARKSFIEHFSSSESP